MKNSLLSQWVVIFLLGYSCQQEKSQPNQMQIEPVAIVQDSVQLIAFEKEIVPILQSRCSPCHFTGGKMYERMPFDKSKTITDHAAGVLKRFKEPELATLKAYIDQETK